MKILITGATGFIGKSLCKELAWAGHEIIALTRSPNSSRYKIPAPHRSIEWNEQCQNLSTENLELIKDVGAVIHLAGESIAQERWTPEYQQKIITSRVKGIESIISLLKSSGHPAPKTFISASAVGYYGDQGDQILTEDSPGGSDFLAQVCQKWESALFDSDLPQTRKVALRFGIVLGRGGGALEKMIPPFLSGSGATLGSGQQWVSWIHLDDLLQVIISSLGDERYSGPINTCTPQNLTQRELTHTLGEVLNRWSFLKAPAPVLKMVLGGFANTLLSSQRVYPKKLKSLGFEFKHGELKTALTHLLNKSYALGHSEFLSSCWIPKPIEEVFAFFSQAENLEKITPPWLNFKILKQSTPSIEQGTLIDYQLKLHGLPIRWRTEISNWNPPFEFTDTQLKGPYHLWCHTHSFSSLAGGTLMEDCVLYELPLGALGRITAGSFVIKDVHAIFDYRQKKIFELLT